RQPRWWPRGGGRPCPRHARTPHNARTIARDSTQDFRCDSVSESQAEPRYVPPYEVGLLFASEIGSGSHDCDAAERIEIEEILVAGHDHVCAPVYGRLEELVVLGVTGRANRLQYVDDLDERCDTFK